MQLMYTIFYGFAIYFLYTIIAYLVVHSELVEPET